MMAPTHAMIGGAVWLSANAAIFAHPYPVPTFAGAAVAAAFAVAPDIDLKGSEASRFLPPVTSLVSWVVRESCGGHRRITHSLLGALLFAAGCAGLVALTGWPQWLALAAACGWLAHIAADMMTIKGCPLRWPDLTPWYLLPPELRVRTGLRPIKVKGSNRRRHTSEWWLVRPAAFVTCVGVGVLILLGG